LKEREREKGLEEERKAERLKKCKKKGRKHKI